MLYAEYKVDRAVEYAKKNAFEDGENKRSQEIAMKMKNANKPVNEITEFTGLSQDEIKRL